MTVYLVGAGPGDPGLLTRRGAELLARADVVVYDRLVDRALLSLARPDAELVDAGKRPVADGAGGPAGAGLPPAAGPAVSGAARQDEINSLLVARGRTGKTVVRLKGGDPFLFGRGGEEAEALIDAGIPWEVVPGVTSAVAVPAYAGIPITHRGVSTSVTVVTGRVGDPTAPGGVDWAALARSGGTLVVLMGMATRAEIVAELLAGGRPADTPVAVVEWGTTPSQRTVRTTLAGLEVVPLGAPSVVVVGPVAALDLAWTAERPLAGVTVAVTRPRRQAGPLAAALSVAGARVVEVPLVEIVDPDDDGEALRRAAAEVAGYDWVVFTSANAVHRFVTLLRDGRALGAARLAAVGAATESALAGYHLAADLVPPVATAEGLVAAVPTAPQAPTAPATPPAPQAPTAPAASAPQVPTTPAAGTPGARGPGRVLFPRAAEVRGTLPDGLREKGWQVDEVVAYRTLPAPPPPLPVVAALAGAGVVVFASPSAVTGYLAMATARGEPLPVPPVVACIGPVTAAAARDAGLAVAVEPPSPLADALVAAIVAHLAAGAGEHGRPHQDA